MKHALVLFAAAALTAACAGAPPAASPAPAPQPEASQPSAAPPSLPRPVPQAQPATTGSHAPPESTTADEPEDVDDATAPVSGPAVSSSPPDEPLPPHLAHPVAFERPYKLGQRPRLKNDELAREDDQELARWNEGGRRGAWHPQPRVMVDNVRVQGNASDKAILREARKEGYWPIRKCYDAALPGNQGLRGKVSLRFTLRANGKVASAALAGTPSLPDKGVSRCLVTAFRGLSLVRPRKGTAKVTIDIGLNPGDAPMKAVEEPAVVPGPGAVDSALLQGLVAAGSGATAQQCYEHGLARVPGLWGRLALRADISADGTIQSLVETESTFPDPDTAQCIAEAVRAVRLPPPKGGEVRVVFPIRLGPPA